MTRFPFRTSLVCLALCAGAAGARAQCEIEKLVASDGGTSDSFSRGLALSGDTILVGAYQHFDAATGHGAAYVYERTPNGWVEQEVLHSTDPEDANFGWTVALDGDTALVGAPHDDDLGPFSGSAYFFERQGATWALTNKVTASNGTPQDQFGFYLSLSGDVAVISSGLDDGYVFERGPAGWVERSRINASGFDSTASDVAIHGDTILVGSSFTDGVAWDSGAAAFFQRMPNGWVEVACVTASDGAERDLFGGSVAVFGDRAVIGATWDDTPVAPGSGSVYVFERVGGVWTETDRVVPADAGPFDYFGSDVALFGDSILGGSPYHEIDGDTRGAAYLFERSPDGWVQRRNLSASDGEHHDRLGSTVALGEGTALVGNFADDDLGFNSGSAYVFSNPDFAAPFCSCEAGPCGNDAPLMGCINSTGASALLAACGTASVAADDLELRVTQVPAFEFGILFYGAGQTQAPAGDGQRCVSGGGVGLFRLPVRFTGAGGTFGEGPGIVAFSHFLFVPAGHILAGQTWSFQAWYRDSAGPCGSGYNFSNGLAVTFAP